MDVRPALLIDRTLIYPNGTYRELSWIEYLKLKVKMWRG